MKNCKSGSLLLACALGLTGCGSDKATTDAATDAAADSTIMDATTDASDSAVVVDTRAIRLVVAPFGYPNPGGGLAPQAFDVCVRPGGTTTRVLATVNSMNPPSAKRSLPVGAISQHSFPAAQLEQICGFPANPLPCVAEVYRSEDVAFSLQIGVPICVLGDAGITPIATIDLTATTFTGSNAFTVAFVGDANEVSGARAPKVVVFSDERVATDGTKARVRIVNLDPNVATQTGLELCRDTTPGVAGGNVTLLGDANSTAAQLNPAGMLSAYFNVDPLAPATVPFDGGTMTIPIPFNAHIPASPAHCNGYYTATDGLPVTVWPPATDAQVAAIYAQYNAGVADGGAKPVTSLAAGEVVTFYLMRVATGMPFPADTTVISIPMLDSPIAP